MNNPSAQTRRVLITVKTYPTLSKKYDELVCTAGILDDGTWARIYPLPFRKLEYEDRYKKYQWIELPLIKNSEDPRPESYRVADISKVKKVGEPIGTKDGWAERKRIIFDKNEIYTDLSELIAKANRNELSLALFKPTKILDFVAKQTEREWSPDKLLLLETKARQLSLFQTQAEVQKEFQVIPKLPYKFSYRFKDCNGRESTQMIEDWEIGSLYWNCLEREEGNENAAIDLVRKKYLEEFSAKDLCLFLGTTRQYHGWASNPFVIIGVFYPPIQKQQTLL